MRPVDIDRHKSLACPPSPPCPVRIAVSIEPVGKVPSLHMLLAVSLLAIGAEDVYNEHIRPMAASQAFAIPPIGKTSIRSCDLCHPVCERCRSGIFLTRSLPMGVNQQCTRRSIDEVVARRREVRI